MTLPSGCSATPRISITGNRRWNCPPAPKRQPPCTRCTHDAAHGVHDAAYTVHTTLHTPWAAPRVYPIPPGQPTAGGLGLLVAGKGWA
eukprot:3494255-Rhodomonas_salina.1